MPPTDTTRRRMCERQLARLHDSAIERHELLNVATTLMLLAATPASDVTDDVEGHCSGLDDCSHGERVVRAQRHLQWVRSQAQASDVDELYRRTRCAAQELACHLKIVSPGDTHV